MTLNSPDWERSLREIKHRHGANIILGAGTVLSAADVDKVKFADGQVIISPNMRPDVIQRSKELGLISMPGCYTPTECFAALEAGADVLKIFPADTLGISFIKALRAVLPEETRLCPTGGVTADTLSDLLTAGAFAVGIGSALYQQGKSLSEIALATENFTSACQST